MSLPEPIKTWEFSFNNLGGRLESVALDFPKTLWQVKNVLCGGGNGSFTSPFTVSLSSDSASSGASDLWTDYTKLVWGTSNWSWIVLKSGGTKGFEICVSLEDDYVYRIGEMILSPSGAFSGGSTSARPTASDEVSLWVAPRIWLGGYALSHVAWVHCWMSDDGEAVRLHTVEASNSAFTWMFERAQDYNSSLWDGYTYYVDNDYNSFLNHVTGHEMFTNDGEQHEVGIVFDGPSTSYFNQASRQTTEPGGEWAMTPMEFHGTKSLRMKGYAGKMTDVWWGQWNNKFITRLYPRSASPRFVSLYNQVVPFDGATILRAH